VSPPQEPAIRLQPPDAGTPAEKPAPEPVKKDTALAPEQKVAVEKSAPPTGQKQEQAPSVEKPAEPAAGTKPAGIGRLLLSASPLVLAMIALLIAVKAFRATRPPAPKAAEPATGPPKNEPEIERPAITPEEPPVNEKRRAPRLNRLVEVDFSVTGRFFRGFINNFSETGVYVDTPEKFTVGQEITIACPDIDTGGYTKRTGLIVRLTQTGIAVHFQQNAAP
jgi:hypothetical protein